MSALLDRFRRVEVSLADGAAVPAQRPDVVARLRGRGPRRARSSSRACRPRHRRLGERVSRRHDRGRPMSLRDMFVALTRAGGLPAASGDGR